MVLFWPIQQELDCINDGGQILGKIRFDISRGLYSFFPADDSIVLSSIEETMIADKISDLKSGEYTIPMQDDD